MKRSFMLILLVSLLLYCCSAAANEIDFSRALVIGSGGKTVVEFTDPDCPFCRKASLYLDGRSDITRYVFFNPLKRHPKAREKAQYILSQQNRVAAYHEVMSGRLDASQAIEGITPQGVKLLEEQVAVVRKMKVAATPTFIINGRVVEGFEPKKMEEMLGPK